MSSTDAPAATNVEIWVDPGCPFCWTTARWLVESVSRLREIDITWNPISLFIKNAPDPESQYYAVTLNTLKSLRVMLAISDKLGNQESAKAYWEFASRIHHDQDYMYDIADALTAVGIDPAFAAAAEDESYDERVNASMADAFTLTGDDVGTPIIAITKADGSRAGYYGPVITRIPDDEASANMWDALVTFMSADSFFELKRGRTEGPNPGGRPAPLGS